MSLVQRLTDSETVVDRERDKARVILGSFTLRPHHLRAPRDLMGMRGVVCARTSRLNDRVQRLQTPPPPHPDPLSSI